MESSNTLPSPGERRREKTALSERYGVLRSGPMTASPFRRLQRAALLFFCCLSVQQGYGQAAAVDLDGKPQDPVAGASGRVVVLVFLRTDCPVSNRYAQRSSRSRPATRGSPSFFWCFPPRRHRRKSSASISTPMITKLPALRDPQHVLVKQAHAQITPEVAVFDKRGTLVYPGRVDNLYEDFGRMRRPPPPMNSTTPSRLL